MGENVLLHNWKEEVGYECFSVPKHSKITVNNLVMVLCKNWRKTSLAIC